MSTAEHVALVADLRRLVAQRLVDPLEILLDDATGLTDIAARLRIDAEVWAAQLLGPDPRLAAHAAARLVAALYPSDAAFDPPDAWWATPLGRAVARAGGHPGAAAVPYSTAGAMLGITRQGVGDLVRRGKLERHPDGGVSTESVRDRLNPPSLEEHRVH